MPTVDKSITNMSSYLWKRVLSQELRSVPPHPVLSRGSLVRLRSGHGRPPVGPGSEVRRPPSVCDLA